MDQPETFLLTLPPLLHIVFYAGGVGILAALLQNALRRDGQPPALMAALSRTLALVAAGSLLFTLVRPPHALMNILSELVILLLLALGGIAYTRFFLKQDTPVLLIIKTEGLKTIIHSGYIFAVVLYFAGMSLLLYIILGNIQAIAAPDLPVIASMGALNLFLAFVYGLFYRLMPLDPERAKHKTSDTLRIMVWPLIVALLLFIAPLIMEKYVQSEDYLRSLNPPQRLHGV